MKKIILFAFVATLATITYGQRKVDMSTTMTSPTASTVIRVGVPFSINFTVTNLGPDVIKPADTITYILSVNSSILLASNFKVSNDLAVNGTANFSVSNVSLNGAGGNIVFCSHGVLINRALPDSVKDNVIGGTGNNNSCVTLKFSGTGVGKIQLASGQKVVAYPNPASTELTIAFNTTKEENTSVEIYDLQGRIVKTINNGLTSVGDQSVNVDLSDMTKGVYFYKVITGNTSVMDKFIVE